MASTWRTEAYAALPLRCLRPLFLLALLATLLPPSSTAQSSNTSYTTLYNDLPVLGSLPAAATAYYVFQSAAVSYQQTALISVDASVGSPALYMSLTNPTPSASSFDYAASWQTGGVISIAGTTQQPPYTAYIAVVSSSYSACNYSVLVTAYDSAVKQATPIPLQSVRPLSSAIAAGEYRYFTYNVAAGTNLTTVALTETYGQAWLLLNSPNTTALPTIDSAQYSSDSPTFPLVALTQPAAGTWTIGVWSNQSSAFSIVAVDVSDDTQPMELGVIYPGAVQSGEYAYYSIYVDELQLSATAATGVNLAIELNAVLGGIEACCSNTTDRPSFRNYRTCTWVSSDSRSGNRLLIPTSQLQPGTLYCGVNGYAADVPTFTISASYGSAITLPAGETVTAQADVGSSQLYSFVFPASEPVVTLSVVSDVGTTALYIGAYGWAPGVSFAMITTTAATQQLEQILSSRLCGVNNSLAIPGSSPPLCQMEVLVVSSSVGVYRITAGVSGQTALIPGQALEGAVSTTQPAYLSFTIPDNLSNVTLVVTVTNGASDLTLAVGSEGYNAINFVWTVSQPADSNVLYFQLDWTDPKLYYRNQPKGTYVAVLTASSIPITFSAVYTATNGSIYSDSIVTLQDGVPQQGVVGASAYSFYYFALPVTSTPFTVTVNVEWTSGSGTLRAAATNGSQVGPVLGDTIAFISTSTLVMQQNTMWTCNRNNTACGYSLSVQGDRALSQQAVYTITATTSNWVRTLYINDQPELGTVLAVSDTEYWQASSTFSLTSVDAHLMVSVEVLSGSITVYGSSMVSEPNATTAQTSWPALSSTSLLSFPVPPDTSNGTMRVLDGQVYLTVTCTSTDGTACEYTLQVRRYEYTPTLVTITNFIQNPPYRLLIPAGGIVWMAYSTAIYQSAAYVILQAAVVVGTPSLYASCINYQRGISLLPNETSSTWQAVTVPLAIEVADFNAATSNCTYFVLGVRAGGGQAAQVDVSAAAAGTVQSVRYSAVGFSTPAYPVSRFQYILPAYVDVNVLSFGLWFGARDSCPVDQLQLAVSDTVPQPDPADPSTYNFSSTAVVLANGVPTVQIAVSNYTRPAGSLRAGKYYYAAVRSTAGVACTYSLVVSELSFALHLDEASVVSPAPSGLPTWYTFTPVAYNSSTTIALQLNYNSGALSMLVGVNTAPSPSDPSTYLLSALYNTAQPAMSGRYTPQALYVPASACSSPDAMGEPCTLIVMASTSNKVNSQPLPMRAMTSAKAVRLLEGEAANATSSSTTYQFDLPASPLAVTLTINSSTSPIVWCSYQYVTPDATFNDWQWQAGSSGNTRDNSSSSQLTFAWGNTTAPQLLTNANTPQATPPTTCYCTVDAGSSQPYSMAFSTAPLPSSTPASGGRLGRAELTVAIVVPVVAVLLLLAGVMWVRRGGDGCRDECRDMLDKAILSSSSSSSRRQSQQQQQQGEMNVREVSMVDLSSSRASDGALISGRWQSDSA